MQLRVSSEQFQEAMAMAAAQDRRSRAMMVSFREGLLHFETRYWNHAIPAEGEWTESVVVRMGWARKLNGKPFDADPLTLKVERGQLFAETFSTPCKLMSTMDPFDPMLDDPKDEERIRRAARLLGRMLVNLEDIRDSVQQARDRMHEPWHDNKLKTLKLAAEAWVVLSPGVRERTGGRDAGELFGGGLFGRGTGEGQAGRRREDACRDEGATGDVCTAAGRAGG